MLITLNNNKEKYMCDCIDNLMESDDYTYNLSQSLCLSYWSKFYSESQEIIDINSTYKLLNENDINIDKTISDVTDVVKDNIKKYTGIDLISKKSKTKLKLKEIRSGLKGKLIASDAASAVNKIKGRPQGIIITDTFNHPVYPLSHPKIDTSKFDLREVKKRFHEEHSSMKLDFLPWHFIIEYINNEYFVFNTRPIDMKFPLNTNEVEQVIQQNAVKINDRTKTFLKQKPFDIDKAIHVGIVGNSYKDVYLLGLYEMLGRCCAGPFLSYFKLPNTMWSKTWALNCGSKFKTNLVEQYLKR